MAECSEAFVLWKTGGGQNVVQLRTLKRTRLASREHVEWKHRQLDIQNSKKPIFCSVIRQLHPTNSWSIISFVYMHRDGQYALSKKQNRIEISPERKEFKAKEEKEK